VASGEERWLDQQSVLFHPCPELYALIRGLAPCKQERSTLAMSSSTLVRWSGLSLLIGGLLLALFFLFHPSGGDPPTAREASGSLYGFEHTLGVVALLLLLLGLLGVYVRLETKQPWLVLPGCLLAFLGSALLLGTVFSDAYLVPTVATQAPRLLGPDGPLASGLRIAFIFASVFDGLGFLLLGIAALLLGGRSRWAGDVLIIGAVLLALPIAWVITVIGVVVLGLGQIWLGYTIWSGQDFPTRPPWLSKERLVAVASRAKQGDKEANIPPS
jgi:hypothetical protein